MARLKVDSVGQFGLVSDIPGTSLPPNAWTRVQNIRFDLGSARNAGGYETIDTPSEEGTYLLGIDVAGYWYTIYPSDTAIYSYSSGTETDISRATGYVGDYPWTGCVLGGVAILNNYSDCPQYWAGSSTCADLIYDGSNTWDAFDGADGEYRAKVIRSYRNFLFALGISEDSTEYPFMVHWSNPADPGAIPDSWDYTNPDNLSGRVDLSDTSGYVVDALPLRDVLVVYKEDSVWVASYVGGQYQFRFDKIGEAQGLGIFATDCAVDIGGRHIVLGQGIVYMHDGNSVMDILRGHAAEALFQNIDPTNYEKTFLLHCPCSKEVFICYPPVGSSICSRAYVYNYADKTWSWREIPAINFAQSQVVSSGAGAASWPASSDTTTGWDDNVTSSWDTRGYSPISDTIIGIGASLWQFSNTPLFGGVAPRCILERTGLQLGKAGQVSLVRAVYPRVTGTEVLVRVGYQLTPGGGVVWNTPQIFDPEVSTKVDVLVAGVYHAIRFATTTGETWRLDGYELDLEPVGDY